MVKLLALDTSTDACSVALFIDQQCQQRFQVAPRQHAELLLNMMAELLIEADCQLHELDAIAFGEGPGSFIGVRIATAVAQSLGFAINLPLVPISSLRALAQQAYRDHRIERVVAAWDARMGEVYWGIYQLDSNQCMQAELADRLTTLEELNTVFERESPQPACIMAGNAWGVYRHQLTQALQYASQVDSQIYPSAQAVAILAAQSYRQGQVIIATTAQPLYLRNHVANKPLKD